MTDIWINGRDIVDFRCVATSLSGWSDLSSAQLDAVAISGRAGSWLAIPATYPRRTMRFGLYFTPTSVATRKTELDALMLALQGVIEVRINDDPNRFVYARVASSSLEGVGSASLAIREALLDLQLESTDPYFYALVAEVTHILCDGATYTAVPVGTAPQGGFLRLVGAGTSPCTIVIADRAGTPRYTMTLTTTWTAAEYVDIDFDQWTITRWNNVTSTNIMATLGTTETFPIFDPGDAPMVKITNAVSATYYSRKAYLS
jgi:hypothetical protein